MKTIEDEPKGLPPGRAVDLGDVNDVIDGENLALRHQTSGGIPTTGTTAEAGGGEERGLKRLLTDLRSYKELRRTPYGLGPITILAAISFFGYFDAQAFSVARPFIVRDLEIDIQDIIEIAQIVGVFTIFGALFIGWLADRTRRVPYVAIGAIFSGVFSIVSSRATSMFSLGLPRVLDTVADDAAAIPRFSLIADYYPPEVRGKAIALSTSMRRLAGVLSIFVVGLVLEAFGWRTALFAFGIPLIIVGVVALVRLREPKRGYFERKAMGAADDDAREEDDPVSFGEGWRRTFSIRTLRRLFIADIFTAVGDVTVGLFAVFFFVETYNLSAFELSLLGLPTLVTGLAGGLYGGAIIDRFTRRSPGRVLVVLAVFALISSFGVLGYAWAPALVLVIGFSSILAFGNALVGPASAVVYSQILPPALRTQGLQVLGMAQLPALIVFTPVASAIFANNGYRGVFLFAVPFFIVGAIIAMTAGSTFDLDARAAFAAAVADQEWRRARQEGRAKLLVIRDADVAYDGVQVLFNVDLDVEEGEIIALLGTNGAGKSTLLRAISGTQPASGGAIVFDGRDITQMPPHEVAARGVVHMPGGRGVFPGMTVRDNLLLANWMTDDQDEIKSRLSEVFEIFPTLVERLDAPANALSGGEQQQLSLAQAFLSKPKLLMIDELSLGLSPAVVGQLLEIVREIHRRGVTVIVVEQSVNVALTLATKAVFMEKGEIRFFGPTADLLERPDILRAVYVKGTGALTSGATSAQRSERRQRELALSAARPALEVKNLVRTYGGVVAVDDVSFELREGEVLGLIGPNGAGKTTIFDLISGFQVPDSGQVIYEGVDITSLPSEERARQGLVRRFQDARLFPALTVTETLLIALEQKLEVKSAILNAAALPQARRAERRLRVQADRLIDLLELGAFRDKFVRELSTGVRRIVDLACVIATEPKVLLLDEPSSGIAQAEAEGLAPLLRRIRFETGCSILIIEHDMPLISAVSDELIALERGAFVVRGTPAEVLNNERVIESYLGGSEAAVNRSGRTP